MIAADWIWIFDITTDLTSGIYPKTGQVYDFVFRPSQQRSLLRLTPPTVFWSADPKVFPNSSGLRLFLRRLRDRCSADRRRGLPGESLTQFPSAAARMQLAFPPRPVSHRDGDARVSVSLYVAVTDNTWTLFWRLLRADEDLEAIWLALLLRVFWARLQILLAPKCLWDLYHSQCRGKESEHCRTRFPRRFLTVLFLLSLFLFFHLWVDRADCIDLKRGTYAIMLNQASSAHAWSMISQSTAF